jgi:protein TonB
MFEDAFVRPGSGRRLSLPAAIALHGLAIGAIVGSSVWFPGEPPEPPVVVRFPKAVPRPNVAGIMERAERTRTSSPKGSPAPATVLRVPIKTVLPSRPAQDVPSRIDVPPGDDFDGGDDLGQDRPAEGNGNGTDTGTGTGTDVGPGSDAGLVRPGGDVRPPELSRRVEPQYPEAARKAHVDGIVILDAVIAATGEVEEVRVIRSAGRLLDDAAAAALRKWFYRPATLNGRAVRVLLTVTVEFRIH